MQQHKYDDIAMFLLLVLAAITLFGPAIMYGIVLPFIAAIKGDNPNANNRQKDSEKED